MNTYLEKLGKNKFIFVLINLITMGVFFALNCLTPLQGDDFDYQYIFGASSKVESVSDIITSMQNHYFTWGGRITVHFIDQYFLMRDKIWFNIANTLVLFLAVSLIYYCACGRKISNSFLVLLYAGIWFCVPGVGASIITQTVSCNYLWGSTIILCAFTPYFIHLDRSETVVCDRWSVLRSILMLIGAFAAGTTIEAGGAMMLSGMVLIIGYDLLVEKRRVPFWMWTGLVGGIMGYAVLILAPGNYVRAAKVKAASAHANILIEYIYRIARETYYMLIDMGSLLFVFVLFLVLVKTPVGISGKKAHLRDFCTKNKSALLMGILAMIGVYVMTLSVAYADRVLVTPIFFMLIGAGCLYRNMSKENRRLIIFVCVCFVGLAMCTQAVVALYQMRSGELQLNIRTLYTETSS